MIDSWASSHYYYSITTTTPLYLSLYYLSTPLLFLWITCHWTGRLCPFIISIFSLLFSDSLTLSHYLLSIRLLSKSPVAQCWKNATPSTVNATCPWQEDSICSSSRAPTLRNLPSLVACFDSFLSICPLGIPLPALACAD